MMFCQSCGEMLVAGSHFCHQCGHAVPISPPKPDALESKGKASPRFGIFLLTLLGSIALTLILTLVFHLPIFILGAFLPFFWPRKKES